MLSKASADRIPLRIASSSRMTAPEVETGSTRSFDEDVDAETTTGGHDDSPSMLFPFISMSYGWLTFTFRSETVARSFGNLVLSLWFDQQWLAFGLCEINAAFLHLFT